MLDKGYPFPLYSLDLLRSDMSAPESPRYALFLPQGRLVVRPGLRLRGTSVSTAACEDAVARALAALSLGGEALRRFGFHDDWRDALLYWRRRMVDGQLAAIKHRAEAAAATTTRQRLAEEGRRLWGRLSVCARLAQLAGLVTRGRAPARGPALLQALQDAATRAQRHREQLERHGFGAAEQAALVDLLDRLEAALRSARPAPADAALQVMRGAILGDIALLCQAGKQVLHPAQVKALRLRRAFLLRA